MPAPTVPIDYEAAVAEFHDAFQVPRPTGDDQNLYDHLRTRMALIAEEFVETAEALDELMHHVHDDEWPAQHWSELAKELTDLLYVTVGTAELLGIPMGRTFAAVHRSNMSKLGADGKPILREDGKVLKGPDYEPADLSDIVEEIRATHAEFAAGA
ncbi:MazG nucleotide pyrophosphohydrolase domain-containing protein [Streptomyces sp. NPDC091027]|uniref:MazG nucleotide pyrophosphohydrolase domain-containing protein n=1 Tax=Streptomyces sp. NPDC091027 TaxID=3365971 RepID=UPI00382AE955